MHANLVPSLMDTCSMLDSMSVSKELRVHGATSALIAASIHQRRYETSTDNSSVTGELMD